MLKFYTHMHKTT